MNIKRPGQSPANTTLEKKISENVNAASNSAKEKIDKNYNFKIFTQVYGEPMSDVAQKSKANLSDKQTIPAMRLTGGEAVKVALDAQENQLDLKADFKENPKKFNPQASDLTERQIAANPQLTQSDVKKLPTEYKSEKQAELGFAAERLKQQLALIGDRRAKTNAADPYNVTITSYLKGQPYGIRFSNGTQAHVVSTASTNGRVVRLHLSDGQNAIVAYNRDKRSIFIDRVGISDAAINRFTDAKGSSLFDMYMRSEFNRIPEWRRNNLHGDADKLVSRHTKDGSLSFTDMGNIANTIAGWSHLTNMEKAFVWSRIAEGRGRADNVANRFLNSRYNVSNEGALPEVIDDGIPVLGNSLVDRRWNTANHAFLEFTDGYHARMSGPSGDNGRAEQLIDEHEGGWTANAGDAAASRAIVNAFRAFRREGFAGFAREWNRGFTGR